MARAKTTGRSGRSSRSAPQQKRAKQQRRAPRAQSERRSAAATAEAEMEQAIGQSEALWHAGAERTAGRLQTALGSAVPVAEGMEQMLRGWVGFLQRAAQNQTRLMQEMMRLSASQDAMQAQFTYLDETLRNVAESTNSVFRASGRIAERAAPALAASLGPAVRNLATGRAEQAYRDHLAAQGQGRSSGNGSGFAASGRRSAAEARWQRD